MFVWKAVNYNLYRNARRRIFKYHNSKNFMLISKFLFLRIFYIYEICDVIKLCFHASYVYSFIDQILTTLSLVSWNDTVFVDCNFI
jgi:hypothetical protein